MYPSLPKYDVFSEIKNRINDIKFVASRDKCALIELATLSLGFMSFTIDQKILQTKATFIYRCSNFSMFWRNLYSKSGRKSYLYNVKRPLSMVEKC